MLRGRWMTAGILGMHLAASACHAELWPHHRRQSPPAPQQRVVPPARTPVECPPPSPLDVTPSAPPTEPGRSDAPPTSESRDPQAPLTTPESSSLSNQQQRTNPQLNFPTPQSTNLSTARSSGGQSAAPNFIGDFFGAGGGTITVQLPNQIIPITTRDFSQNLGAPLNSSIQNDRLVLTNPGPITIFGDTSGTIPANSQWTSTDIFPNSTLSGLPNSVQLGENLDETRATEQAFGVGSGGAVAVIFNNSSANRIDPSADYDITSDYTIVDTAQIVTTALSIDTGNIAETAAQIGRVKLAENVSPIPRDRVYVNYSYFDNVPLQPGGVNVNRVTPGVEKTFLDGNMSVELRTPFASTLDSTVSVSRTGDRSGLTNTDEAEFGNMTVYLKALLYSDDVWAWSTGIGASAPTANDQMIRDRTSGLTYIRVQNRSVHVLPFIGGLYTPNDRFFAQAFMQMEIDTNGNPVSATSFDTLGEPTGNLSRIGRPTDYTFMYFDFSVGYWMFRDRTGDRWITGIAPMAEVHHNQSVKNAGGATGAVTQGTGTFTWDIPAGEAISNTNAVVGVTSIVRDDATLTLGYAVPLYSDDSQFDGELRVNFNWLFGNSKPSTSRMMRAAR